MQSQNANGVGKDDWRQTVGMFTDDEGLKEVFEEAMKLREKDRQRAYRKFDKKAASRKVKK